MTKTKRKITKPNLLNKIIIRLKTDCLFLDIGDPSTQWLFPYDIDNIDDPMYQVEKMAIENVKEYLKSLIDDIEMEDNNE